MSTISVVIIARDEEKNIVRCLGSVRWADEVIVIDTGSSDKTPEMAESLGARLYRIEWRGFGNAKQFGVDKATGRWVLSVDADEEITEVLASEVAEAVKDSDFAGYDIPRRTSFMGRWIRHSRWYPDYVLRLFRKETGGFTSSLVHEKVEIDGNVGRLKHPILHYSYPDVETYMRKLETYTSLAARELHKKGKRFSVLSLVLKPIAAFSRHYITGAGFLDGVEGFMIASLSAFGVLTKYIKLRSLERAEAGDKSTAH
ncbi:MAG: glycosyltransferase family 2 protein [Candidatus Zixiibacteriota bacterium]|nr:MAG: glycosyltransferase family 2 protein [candidate division Zixibacteria bacterium]